MSDAQRNFLLSCAVYDLQHAARISGGHDGCLGGFDMLQLAFQKIASHFWLDEIVNSGTATAPGALREFNQLEIRNCFQHLSRLCCDFLPMAQVAGFVISDDFLWGATDSRGGDANLSQPFVDIFNLIVPQLGPMVIERVVLQELRIMFQMRTATGGIGNDGVKLFRRKLVNLFACESLCEFPFAVVRVQ